MLEGGRGEGWTACAYVYVAHSALRVCACEKHTRQRAPDQRHVRPPKNAHAHCRQEGVQYGPTYGCTSGKGKMCIETQQPVLKTRPSHRDAGGCQDVNMLCRDLIVS